METKNPLMPIMLVSILTIAQTLVFQDFSVFRIFVAILFAVFLILYFTKNKFAGLFNFFAVALIYPIYFVSIYFGFENAPKSNSTYIIMGIIYLVSLVFLWLLKKKYDVYFSEQQTES